MKRVIAYILFVLIFSSNTYSQILDPVKWKFSVNEVSNNIYELIFTAKIDAGWYMYGLNIKENGPVPTSFRFTENTAVQYMNNIAPGIKPEVKYDPTFEMDVELFSHQVYFSRRVKKISDNQVTIEGAVEYMVCDDSRCLPPKEVDFSFKLPEKKKSKSEKIASAQQVKTQETITPDAEPAMADTPTAGEMISTPDSVYLTPDATPDEMQPAAGLTKPVKDTIRLWMLFLKSLLGGLLVIITPCVYPIIPLTVSYFSREAKSRYHTLFNAMVFGLSIIAIYTLIGLLSGLFRIDLTRAIANHWIPNLIFFLIFLALAASFFGMFELVLPGSLANRIDRQADKGGILGSFFVALATAIVSFSCTGPIAGLVLGNAMKGDIITPVVGMFGFGLSFSLPFTLLAIFPGIAGKLPKSGGWLNTVKVVLAFIILAFSLMFLANLRLPFITRDLVISLAIAIFFLLGMYLLGKIKFPHDSDTSYIGFFRLLMAIAAFAFALYLIPGLFGAPLKKLSPFLPGKATLGIDLTTSAKSASEVTARYQNICTPAPRYSDRLHLPHNLKGYFHYEEGLACAQKLNKPVLLDFVGETCKNCKKIYAEVWSDSRVLKLLREEFVIIALYTDSRLELPESEWVVSPHHGRVLKTLGRVNNNIQIEKFNSNALPLYVIVDPDGNQLSDLYFYNPDVDKYIEFLKQGLANFTPAHEPIP